MREAKVRQVFTSVHLCKELLVCRSYFLNNGLHGIEVKSTHSFLN